MIGKFVPEESPYQAKHYTINVPDELYELAKMTNGSFNTIFCRLFDLSPANFLRFARDKYNATIHGKKGYMVAYFKDKKDADKLCEELNRRWKYWMKGK